MASLVMASAVVACHHTAPVASDPFSVASPVVTSTFSPSLPGITAASPTQPALPSKPPLTSALPSNACTLGWVTPPPGSPRYEDPLGLIDRISHHKGTLKVVDMRFFFGPESPPSDQGYIKEIERWYVKVYDPHDLNFQGRFILEHNRFGHGVVAVAPYDTKGFHSPDWSGFQWDAGDLTRRTFAGLPGTWEGIRYDFVNGGAGLTIPGLPAAAAGCLNGT
jgi:hypothetical protein